MQYKNIDTIPSFEALCSTPPFSVKQYLNAQRVSSCNIAAGGGFTYNYAAMPVSDDHLTLLQMLCDQQEVIEKYRALLSGEIMNTSEKRMVLHHLARGRVLSTPVMADGQEKGEFYEQELERIHRFSEQVRSGAITGSTGKRIERVIQIGIGGSDLGPRALYLALLGYYSAQNIRLLEARFISNVDPDDALQVLNDIDFETTLFILVSKSGTTQETLTNRDFVIDAMKRAAIPHLDTEKHIIAVTSKTSPLATSGSTLETFFIDDYIGGRYSSTSAVGATVLALAFGFDSVKRLLAGAHEADQLALNPDITQNAALMDAALGIYLRNALYLPSTAILPYAQALSRFPAHVQQLDMESNGKRVNRDGQEIFYDTGPIIFGEPGTNGQHSFYQLLHQGTDTIPLQFIGFKENQFGKDLFTDNSTSQEKLIANLVAQIVAFAQGKDDENKNKEFPGNRFSSLLYAKKLTPEALGALLSHYENKVMFQGFLWNLNSFDQEGVQLGKVLAAKVLNGCEGDKTLSAYKNLFNE